MKRLRVVHVVHSFGLGGMEKGIVNCTRSASPDIEHVMLCLTQTGKAHELLPPQTAVVEMHKPPGNSIGFILRLARELRRLRPDVVHSRNWGGMDGALAGRLARLPGLIHGEHGWEMDDLHGRNRKRRIFRRFVSRSLFRITCVSRHIERWLQGEVRVRCPVRQIYNGVDTREFSPGPDRDAARRELGIPPDAIAIGHVGRLVTVKNHDALLRAFHAVRAVSERATLICVGDGERREELERAAGAGVRFVGHRTDVGRCLRAFDLFALPSHNEGISNTILEAMATGLPVIATRVGGSTELVLHEETGRLVPLGDDRALADALRLYVEDASMRRAHGRRARQVAIERFDLGAMVRSYEEVWRECAAVNESPGSLTASSAESRRGVP